MELTNLAPDLGKLLGINPTTLVLLLLIATRGAAAWARAIPRCSVPIAFTLSVAPQP